VFLDVDGTLVPASLERWFLEYLWRTGSLRVGDLARRVGAAWIRRWPPRWYTWKLAYLRGCRVEAVEAWAEACWESRVRPRLADGMVAAVRWLRTVGMEVVLLSGAPRPLVRPLMTYLGIGDGLWAEPEVVDGVYTGGLIRPHPRGRRKVIQAEVWLRTRGRTWADTVAFADHWSDRFLLRRVAVPVVVRPDWRLALYARWRGWPVLWDVRDPARVLAVLQGAVGPSARSLRP
jgi:fatty acyl-CoA reductase